MTGCSYGYYNASKVDSTTAGIGDGEALRLALDTVDTVKRNLNLAQHMRLLDEPENNSSVEG